MLQQLDQGRLDATLSFLGRQVQQAQVFPVGTWRLLLLQPIVRPPKRHARIQLFPEHVPRKGARLAHQPLDHMPIIDPVLALATQSLHRLHERARVPHLDRVRTDPRFHLLAKQARRHRVGVLLHLNRAALADAHPLPLDRLQALRRQRLQHRFLLGELLLPPPIPSRHHRQHEVPVLLATRKIAAATQQQRLVQLLLETPMRLLAVAVLVTTRRVRRLGHQPVMQQQGQVVPRIRVRAALVVDRQGHAVGAMPLR
ncbi:MAG TPA: hypothetical protein VGH84_13230 [Steroidobacteraceae bacterium]